jgi:hypothetical protein
MRTPAGALAIVMLTAVAGAAAGHSPQASFHLQVAQTGPSVPRSHSRPESGVPRGQSFWPGIKWGQPASCRPGDPLDTTSPDDARQLIEAAGFTDPRNLHKSCDNFWYGGATSAGKPVFVRIDPEGLVQLE